MPAFTHCIRKLSYNDTQNTLTPAIYEKSLNDLEQALAWHKEPAYLKKQSYFYLKLIELESFEDETKKQTRLKQAQTALINSLTLSPIDPDAWLQLAEIDGLLNTPKPKIIEALRLSFYAGRVEPELVIPRLKLTYQYFQYLPEEMQSLWQKQLLIAWTFKAPQLLEFIARNPEAKPIALAAFANTPDEAAKFLSQLTTKK